MCVEVCVKLPLPPAQQIQNVLGSVTVCVSLGHRPTDSCCVLPLSLFASLSLSFSPSLSPCMPFFAVLCDWHTRAHTQLTATTAPAAFCMLHSLPVLSHHWPCTVNHLYLFIRWQAIWESFVWICFHHFLGLCQCCFCWRAKLPPNWKKV